MSAAPADVISWGRESARTGCWRGDEQVAYLSPLPSSPLPSTEFVLRCLDTLAGRGFKRVVTAALSPLEQVGFLAAGFDVEERLHLLGMDISGVVDEVPPGLPLRRVPLWRRGEVLDIDAAAFPAFWRLDKGGLRESLRATPARRFRMAVGTGGDIAGYAITGRSADRGFVQRLAVAPGRQREGTGRRLLLDGLVWLRRGGATRVVVNTQIGNDAALSLYLATGFREEPVGLSVLSAGLQ